MKFDDLFLGAQFRYPLISGDTQLYVKIDDDRARPVDYTRGAFKVGGRTDVVPVNSN